MHRAASANSKLKTIPPEFQSKPVRLSSLKTQGSRLRAPDSASQQRSLFSRGQWAAARNPNGVAARLHAQFGQYRGNVMFDCALRQEKAGSNLAIGPTFTHLFEHFGFPGSQPEGMSSRRQTRSAGNRHNSEGAQAASDDGGYGLRPKLFEDRGPGGAMLRRKAWPARAPPHRERPARPGSVRGAPITCQLVAIGSGYLDAGRQLSTSSDEIVGQLARCPLGSRPHRVLQYLLCKPDGAGMIAGQKSGFSPGGSEQSSIMRGRRLGA